MHTLAVCVVADLRNSKSLSWIACWPRQPGMDFHFRRHPFELDAVLPMPFQRIVAFLEFDAADLGEKIEMPVVATQFAVGDAFEAGVFLQLHNFADAVVLDLAQLFGGDVLAHTLHARVQQTCWTQQAADMIGPEWALCIRWHSLPPLDAYVPRIGWLSARIERARPFLP